jgi:formylglycine-generating enzyme required for sulfatase activity
MHASLAIKDAGRIRDGKIGSVITNSFGMEFSWIPAGTFEMGSPPTEFRRQEDEGPQRIVSINSGFWMGRFEVTQGQFALIMGTNPSFFLDCGADCPVERVAWNSAKEFVRRLNARDDGFVYSLPSEAEWEYAARAGTTTAFSFGNSLSSTQANFDGNYPWGNAPKGPNLRRTTRVGSYEPNAWGLFDMHGNVHEWVEDVYQEIYIPISDGRPNTRGDNRLRVLRGGSFDQVSQALRSAHRAYYNPTYSHWYPFTGFRIVARAK